MGFIEKADGSPEVSELKSYGDVAVLGGGDEA